MLITLDSVYLNLIGAMGVDQKVESMPQNEIVAIIGENKDTGGSNGASKSTFTFASPLSLFGAKAVGKTNKELKNNKIKGTPRVCVKYTIDGKPLIVDRTIGGELKVTYDGSLISGSTDEVQKKLEEIIKLTEDQFIQFSYKGQKNAQHFLTMKDSEKKEFLSSFFNTSDIEKMKELVDLKRIKTEKEKDKTQGVIDQLGTSVEKYQKEYDEIKGKSAIKIKDNNELIKAWDSALKSLESQLNQLKQIKEQDLLEKDQAYRSINEEYLSVKDKNDVIILESKNKIKEMESKIKEAQAMPEPQEADSLRLQIKSLQSKLSVDEVSAELTQAFKDGTDIIKEIKAGLNLINSQKSDIAALEANLRANEKVVQEIDTKPCPTCNRMFDDAHKEERKASFLEKIKDLRGKIDYETNQLNSMSEQFSPDILLEVENEVARIRTEISTFNLKKNNEINLQISDLSKKLDQLIFQHTISKNTIIQEYQLQIKSITNDIYVVQTDTANLLNKVSEEKYRVLKAKDDAVGNLLSQANDLNQKKNSLVKENEKLSSEMQIIENRLRSDEEDLKSAMAKLAELTEKMSVLEHSSFVLSKNGFTGHLFDSILDDLNAEINNNLKLVPVTSNFVLNFASDKTAKTTGEVSKTISYELTKGGLESSLGMTSGAEELVILLAVDEAVEEVLSRKLGIKIGWKFLDEQLFWVDGNSKEYVYEFYRQKSKDKTYYIIDHASEFNAAIDRVIKIVKENDIARIESA